jgi:hypothetical protein
MPALGSAASLGIFKNEDQYYSQTTVLINWDNVANGSTSTQASELSVNRYALSLPTASSSTVTTSTTKFPGAALNSSAVSTTAAYNQTTFTKCVDVAAGCAAFGTGDFTVEMWYYAVSSSARDQQLITTCCPGTSLNGGYNGATTKGFRLSQQASTRNFRFFNDVTVNGSGTGLTFTANAWHHVAITRSSGTIRFFLNGTKGTDLTGTEATSNFLSTQNCRIAGDNQGQAISGYIDDVRITVGVARYTASFTAPTYGYKR